MPPSLKRKLAGNDLAPAQSGIQAFGKIRKAQRDRGEQHGKTKLDWKGHADLNSGSSIDFPGSRKKRKLELSDENIMTQEVTHDFIPSPNYEHPAILPLSPIQQNTPRKRRVFQSKLVETPTKGARSCLESLTFSSSPPSDSRSTPSSPSSNSCKSTQTPPSSPASNYFPSTLEDDDVQKLPDELQDHINLYSSFLTALSLHYAHNGSLTPADLRILRPTIERVWGKRRVLIDDVRRILAIAQNVGAGGDLEKRPQCRTSLLLSDYGRGKICIEIEEDPKHRGLQRRSINEEILNVVFAANLEAQWNHHIIQSDSPSTSSFLNSLPLFPITICASISKNAPLLSKGQRRLEDLKAGAIKAQLSSQFPQTSSLSSRTHPPPIFAPTIRNDSLLSRIRAKQLHQSTLAPPPSPATILRKFALQRLEELAPVLEILTSSASRSTVSRFSDGASQHPFPTSLMDMTEQHGTYSFTMSTLVQHLQMSLKNPIAKEDAVRCIRLLAAEVAPSWVKIKEVGRVVGVTVWRGGRIGREELASRVAELLGKL